MISTLAGVHKNERKIHHKYEGRGGHRQQRDGMSPDGGGYSPGI